MAWELSDDRPIYLQLMEHIQGDILSGVYPLGGKLPSVRDLAACASVIRIQCRKHCPNWSAAACSIPRGPADALSPKMSS